MKEFREIVPAGIFFNFCDSNNISYSIRHETKYLISFCQTFFYFLLFFGYFNSANAQTPDYCSVPLTEKAYDRTNSQIKSSIMFASRDDICSSEYRSIGEARAAARKRGFSLVHKKLSIGANEARQTSGNKWDISQTNFCRATSSDFKSAYSSRYQSEVARAAVSAWLECVRLSLENALYIDYEVASSGKYFTGTLRTTANTGTLDRQITGIAVVGPGGLGVKCSIGGKVYIPNEVADSPVEVKTTGTLVACEKSNTEEVSIAFQTSQGSTEFIRLPSQSEIDQSQADKHREEERRKREEADRLPFVAVWEFEVTTSIHAYAKAFKYYNCFFKFRSDVAKHADILSIRTRPVGSDNWSSEILTSNPKYQQGKRRVVSGVMRPGVAIPVRRNCQHELRIEFENSGFRQYTADICKAEKMLIFRDYVCRGQKTYKNR